MAKYTYPAIFTVEPDGSGVSVAFPDLPHVYTSGKDIDDALLNASDVLPLMLCEYEDNKEPFAKPSSMQAVNASIHDDHAFATLIFADTLEYRKRTSNRAVKKTLSIPAWMDNIARQNNVNFSQVLQNALSEMYQDTAK